MSDGFRAVILGLWGVALAACGRQEPTVAPEAAFATASSATGPSIKILAFGDSLTAGKDLPDPDTQAFPAVLERLLKSRGHAVTVINAGRSGDTTADARSRLDFSLADKPDLVLVALGSNDTFQGKPLSFIEENLEAILRRCRATGAPVVLVGMKTFPNLGPYYAREYEDLFSRVARRAGAQSAPFLLEGVAGRPEMNLDDGIHPNVAGHERIAANLLPTVERALKDR
jgi:acyl-CoA thioesterase-1